MSWMPNPNHQPDPSALPEGQRLHSRDRDFEGIQTRSVELDTRLANAETRTVPATLSSEAPVPRWFGNEILRHDSDSVDLTRAADGLPLLWNHDSNVFIGAVRNITVEQGKLRGILHFSENSRADEVFKDVSQGLLRNMSIGYRIDEHKEDKDGNVEITRWSLHEASMAPVPADNSVGVNRKMKVEPMKNDTVEETRKAEEERIAAIRGLFHQRWTEPKHVDLMNQMITEGATLEEARSELLDLIGINQPANRATPDAHKPEGDFEERMKESLLVRSGIETDEKIIAHCRDHNEFGGMSLVELARAWLQKTGQNAKGSARDVVARTFSTRQQMTTDFPDILADVAFKSLLKAYWDAPETWRVWASTSAVQDFKINHRVNLSEFDSLPVVAEGGTYTVGTFTDLKEPIQLATYGKNYVITRESLINDDVSAFTRIPTAMGLAAARTVGDLVYGVLTSNPLMNQDATNLFDPTHNNDVQAGGSAPDADSVQAGKVAMALQQGPKGEATLGIMPRYGICPVALEGVFNTLMAAQYNPASTAGTLEPNVVQGLLTVVSDHRLDADDPAQWYMAAGQNAWDTVDVAFLNGNQAPFQERRQDDISNDNITYKVRIDAAAAPMDWRGLYRNSGTA